MFALTRGAWKTGNSDKTDENLACCHCKRASLQMIALAVDEENKEFF